jgi:hypothetical protein
MTARPTFIVRLHPKPAIDPIRALRAALKVLGRRFGLTVISAVVDQNQTKENDNGKSNTS